MPEYPPSRIANVPVAPEVRLEKPEFSETVQKTNVTLKPTVGSGSVTSTTLAPAEVVAGKVATGRRPTLDDLDHLQQLGYRHIIDLTGGIQTVSAKQVVSARAIELKSIDPNDPAGAKLVGEAMNGLAGPVYVFADESQVLRTFWQRYYRDSEHLSLEAAKICATRIVP